MTDPSAAPASPRPGSPGVEGHRLLIGVVVLPLVMIFGTAAAALTSRDRLPSPLATHWGVDGNANGTMTLGGFVAFAVVLSLGLWAIGAAAVLVGRSERVRFRVERAAMTWCCGMTAFLSAVMVSTIALNLDKARAVDTHFSPGYLIPALAAGLLGVLVGWALAGARPPAAVTPPAPPLSPGGAEAHPPPTMVLGAGEHPTWEHHQHSRLFLLLSVGSLAGGILVWWWVPILGLVLVVCGVVSLPFASVTVVVDGSGLSVRFGPLGWPRRRIPIAEISEVAVEDIEPIEWGGWGYRLRPGSSAVVLRRGPGLVVHRGDGRAFAVTVDDPEAGAALLDAYRRRDR